jgi:hypothetical protein
VPGKILLEDQVLFGDCTLRHAGLTLRVRTQDVLLGGLEYRRREQQDSGWENEFRGHVLSYATSLGGSYGGSPIPGLGLGVYFDFQGW